MTDTADEIDLANLQRFAIREAVARTNADPAAVDKDTWESAYARHFEDARREAGLTETIQ